MWIAWLRSKCGSSPSLASRLASADEATDECSPTADSTFCSTLTRSDRAEAVSWTALRARSSCCCASAWRLGSSFCLLLQATAVLAALRQRGPGGLEFLLPPLQLRTAARGGLLRLPLSGGDVAAGMSSRVTDVLGIPGHAMPECADGMNLGLDQIVAHRSHPDVADLVQAARQLVQALDHLVHLA